MLPLTAFFGFDSGSLGPKKQFVLRLFFGTFVDSKGFSEIVPPDLTSFSHFVAFSRLLRAALEPPSRQENASPPRWRKG
jgi:hypothetical protein